MLFRLYGCVGFSVYENQDFGLLLLFCFVEHYLAEKVCGQKWILPLRIFVLFFLENENDQKIKMLINGF